MAVYFDIYAVEVLARVAKPCLGLFSFCLAAIYTASFLPFTVLFVGGGGGDMYHAVWYVP